MRNTECFVYLTILYIYIYIYIYISAVLYVSTEKRLALLSINAFPLKKTLDIQKDSPYFQACPNFQNPFPPYYTGMIFVGGR